MVAEATAPIGRGSLLAGRYRLRELVDQGDDGARLWRATDEILNRDVAINVIDADDARADDLIEAARSAAALAGQHHVRVLDAAKEDGMAYVVNEWADAVRLPKLLVERPLTPRRAAWMVRELSGTLVDAHRAGIIHGRLVPESVLVSDSGSVSVAGFCVEHVLRDESAATQEQDVHDLVAILYAALTATWPGSSASGLPPAPRDHGHLLRARQVRAGVPRELDTLCDVVLNRPDAAGTPRTAAEVRAVLSDYLGDATALPTVATEALIEEHTQALDLSALLDDDDDPDGGHDSLQDTAAAPEAATPSRPQTALTYPSPNHPTAPMVAWADPDVAEQEAPPRRGWPVWLRIVVSSAAALGLVAAVLFAFNLGRNSDESPGSGAGPTRSRPATSGKALTPASVHDFDPYQDGGAPVENPTQVPLATDGNPATAWLTSTYKDGPDITVYKPGVGLLVDLGSVQSVASVDLSLVGAPYTLQILTSDADKPPADTQGLTVAGQASGVGRQAKIELNANTKARYVVIWLTGLPQVAGGYRGGVAELHLRS